MRHPHGEVKLEVRYERGSQKRETLAGEINSGVIGVNDII